MSHRFHDALRLAGTVALGVTARRAVDSVRSLLDELDAEPDGGPAEAAVPSRIATDEQNIAPIPVPHAFGPTTAVATYRGVGFRPTTKTSGIDMEKEHVQTAAMLAQEPTLASVQALPEPDTHVVVHDTSSPEPAVDVSARKDRGAVSGSITNVHGRGLRGLRVEVVDVDKAVVGASTTGADGQYEVGEVPPGIYKLRVLDVVDGDFEKSWIGGSTFGSAETFTVKPGKTRQADTVVLRSKARIGVAVTPTKRKVDVVVSVTHRATGAPATGEIELSTKDVKITMALVDGQGRVRLKQAGKKLRIDYAGDEQTHPASTKARLR